MNPQYLNDMFTLKKFVNKPRGNSLLESQAVTHTNDGIKIFQKQVMKL